MQLIRLKQTAFIVGTIGSPAHLCTGILFSNHQGKFVCHFQVSLIDWILDFVIISRCLDMEVFYLLPGCKTSALPLSRLPDIMSCPLTFDLNHLLPSSS